MDEKFVITKKAGIYGIIGNIFLLIIKALVGFMSQSQAMIADSFNSAGDIFASLMTFIGNKIASVPNEYLFSMFISISMIFVASKLLYDSVVTLATGGKLQFSWFLVAVCIATILTKLGLFLYTKYAYSKHPNILLEANMKDHKNDCIVISVDDKTKDLILDIVHSYREIKGIDDIVSTPVGDKYLVFLTIALDGNMSTFESHELADNLENTVNGLDKIYKTIVHVNPI